MQKLEVPYSDQLVQQNLTLLQGVHCMGSTVLSPHVSAGKFAAGSAM
jgi:hypothetical protein